MVKYSELNENQKQAVIDDSKHLRIIAGAGSGKTRVLTMRIVYLIEEKGVNPRNILAITFTNKAASEMKKRILEMLGEKGDGATISTIHSLCVRILKQEIEVLGYPRNFTICDGDDQKSILKEAYKQLNIDKKDMSYASVLDYIANCKYENMTPSEALNKTYGEEKLTLKAKVYEYYEDRLKSMYGLDFDDLILFTNKIFRMYPEILERWAKKYRYIHVDEFQDIDKSQYELIKHLSSCHDNVYVVGDPDQTIYTWRGADVNIIVNFDKDFKDTKTIILNENYRSTNNILQGANSLISNNKARVPKDLFSNNGNGDKIIHKTLPDETSEAFYIANLIRELNNKGYNYKDIAILYRSNYLSREVEKVLIENRIPYVVYGGIRFYERAEVKDILCYLRMITAGDDLAFQRVINQPKRGIGSKTIEAILEIAKKEKTTMYEVIKKGLYAKNQNTFDKFVSMIEKWKNDVTVLPLDEVLQEVLDDSGYRTMLEKDNETDRMENVKSLIDDIKEYSENYPGSSLADYLSMIALYTDKASNQIEESVNLMTVHSAKGLEFKVVFVIGLSDGIFPSQRSMFENKDVEEERRLAYVAYTRAKEKLILTETSSFSYVLESSKIPSRFIKEIDGEYIEHLDKPINESKPKIFDTLNINEIASTFNDIGSIKERLNAMPKNDRVRYKVGDVMIHNMFGEGVITKVEGEFLTIAFSYPNGVKKLKAGHPSLRKKTANDYN